MRERELALEIVTPDGLFLPKTKVQEIVVRRREEVYDPGSEVAVFPLHAPMLVRTQPTSMRFVKNAQVRRLEVGGGFLEVTDNGVVLIVTEPSPLTGSFAEAVS